MRRAFVMSDLWIQWGERVGESFAFNGALLCFVEKSRALRKCVIFELGCAKVWGMRQNFHEIFYI